MPTSTLTPGNDQDERLNPSQEDYDRRFNDITKSEAAGTFNGDSLESSNLNSGDKLNDSAKKISDDEASQPFINNVTAQKDKLKFDIKKILNKKSATGSIIGIILGSVFGVGLFSSNVFMGPMITSSISERANSALGIVSNIENNSFRYRFFNDNAIGTSCAGVTCKYRGLKAGEIAELKARGVTFTPADGHKNMLGKTTFDSIHFEGKTITPDNYRAALKESPLLKKTLQGSKGTLWRSMKNSARTAARLARGVTLDPDVSANNKTDFKSKVYKQVAVGDVDINGVSVSADDLDADNLPDDAINASNEASQIAAGDLSDEVEAARNAVTDNIDAPVENRVGPSLVEAVDREGVSIESTQSGVKRAWGWVNSVDIADLVCTVYKFAHMASVVGRTVALTNTVRYGHIFLSVWDKMKAGDATPEEVENVMNIITSKNTFGQLFDASAAAQYLIHGDLSAEPLTVSSMGSDALAAVTLGMYSLHRVAGGGFISGSFGSAAQGRQILKNSCNLVTNLAFQITATAVTLGVSIISGGGAGAAVKAGNVALKGAQEVATTAAKKTIRELITEAVGKINKTAVRKQIRNQVVNPVNMGMLTIFLVETFGIDYITQSLAGTDVLTYMDDPLATMDAIGVAASSLNYSSTIAMGGSVQTISDATAYNNENSRLIAEAIDMEKLDANPLDANNPYSKLGSLLGNIAIQTSSMGLSRGSFSLNSLLQAPIKSLSSVINSRVSASSGEPTPQQLADFVDDPYMQEEGLCVDFMGSPCAGADLSYLANIDIDELFTTAIERGYIDSEGKIIADSLYATHVNECNNPERIQVDETLFDGDQLMPKHCRDGSSDRKFFNALTSYRALVDDIDFDTVSTGDSSSGGSSDDLTTGTPNDVRDLGRGWTIKDNTDYTSVTCSAGTIPKGIGDHPIINSKFNICDIPGTGMVVNSLVSANTKALIQAAAADGLTLTGSAFRSVQKQQELYDQNCDANGNCNPPTAVPGRSQHERGLALDFSNCGTRGTRCYQWLKVNANKYGYYNLESEPWHWSTSGN